MQGEALIHRHVSGEQRYKVSERLALLVDYQVREIRAREPVALQIFDITIKAPTAARRCAYDVAHVLGVEVVEVVSLYAELTEDLCDVLAVGRRKVLDCHNVFDLFSREALEHVCAFRVFFKPGLGYVVRDICGGIAFRAHPYQEAMAKHISVFAI